jgi:hypothetical protein
MADNGDSDTNPDSWTDTVGNGDGDADMGSEE